MNRHVGKLERHTKFIDEYSYPQGMDYWFWCPGCKENHCFTIRSDGGSPSWVFNRDFVRPTFHPSLIYSGKCHLFLKDGKIQFLDDAKHNLAGQTVEMVALDEDN